MKRIAIIGFVASVLLATYFGFQRVKQPVLTPVEQVTAQFQRDVAALDSAVRFLQTVVKKGSTSSRQAAFRQARLRWKQVEWLAEYYFPATAKAINGAAVPEYEESDAKTIEPEGFQVIEPLLFPTPDPQQADELARQTATLVVNVKRLVIVAQNNPTTDAHIFDALRLEVFRIITLGITGFDSPVALHSLPETQTALQSLEQYLAYYQPVLLTKRVSIADSLQAVFRQAPSRLRSNPDAFNSFDRLAFITEIANPLSSLLLDAQNALDIKPFQESRGLRSDARTLFAANVFDVNHYTPGTDYRTTPGRIALGKMLFADPILSGDGRRSCLSCHQPERAFTDAMPQNRTLDGRKAVLRNTPTLWNVGLQRALFADSRVAFLEDQATDVVTNVNEMHGSLEKAANLLKANPVYTRQFAASYADGITPFTIRNALASYERSRVSLNSRFDRYVRGERAALDEQEIRGFNLFAGKAKCATCHFLPLTNGLVPPHFEKSESENLGVPQRFVQKGAVLDADLGKFNHTGGEIHRRSFKTPTVRNVELTAPYMHNGAFQTLEEVIDFYDQGGGKGLGLDPEFQTLPEDRLQLTQSDKAALIAFLKSLTDSKSATNL
ncbi:cytochrome c peroxidase [Larkinella terrae]|uniref:Cytochrome-c peroxidase n=1 Tax=Larkinella terrae TaxID=2025311 RepID=A0A7K0EEZ1_9BACT|nr:cytochrome c peroxidase [Larkinella terrae]MRS60026.1 cytochrome-c peroxidase [Larkinella terrae]